MRQRSGTRRGRWHVPDLCLRRRDLIPLLLLLLPGVASARILITEIHYHPAGSVGEAEALEFIELFNDEPLPFDVSGYRLAGGVEYGFPLESIIEARGVVVVARSPDTLADTYGIDPPFGPFSGRLANEGEEVLLVDTGGSTVARVRYDDRGRWPVAPDGFGPSLVLRDPFADPGEGESWGWSPEAGGSPGALSFDIAASEVLLNEVARGRDGGFVELFNPGPRSMDIGGYRISGDREAGATAFEIPADSILPPRGFFVVEVPALGFPLDPDGQLLVVRTPDGERVVDAWSLGEASVEDLSGGGSEGRFPDGGRRWFRLSPVSMGAPNLLPAPPPVVISEIHYHPWSDREDEEFIEITNTGEAAVALDAFAFTSGVDFEFPAGTVIAPGEFLVIAKDPATIEAAYRIDGVLGPYGGVLANAGEMLRLADGRGNPVDEVRYYDEGSWPRWSDGHGPSLELLDVRQDNAVGSAWGESDHAAGSEWVAYEYTGVQSVGDSELHLYLLGAGETLVDDIEVTPAEGGENLIPDGDFDGPDPLRFWRIEGTHVESRLEVGGGPDGTNALRIVASGRGDTRVNRIERQTSPNLIRGRSYTVRFKARWLRGADAIMTRSWNHGMPRVHRLAVPRYGGTPGRPNSRALAASGPVVSGVEQIPALPGVDEPVTIRARVSDPDGVASVRLHYRMDGAAGFTVRELLDDGSPPDARAEDGIHTGTIEAMGRRAGVAEFFIEARDRTGASRTSPPDAPDGAFVYQYDDGERAHEIPAVRVVLRRAELEELQRRSPHSNHLLSGSLVYGGERIFHAVGVRYRGSPYLRRDSITGSRKGVRVRLSDEKPLQNDVRIVLDEQEADATRQVDRLVRHLLQKAGGIPYGERRYVHLLLAGTDLGTYEQVLAVDRRYLERAFGEENSGRELYKIDAHYELNDQGEFAFPTFTSWKFTDQKEELRFTYKKRSHEEDDDFSGLMELLALMDLETTSDAEFDARAPGLLDLGAWVRGIAVYRAVEDWDAIGGWTGKNVYLYRHPGGRWRFIPWDHDVAFGQAALQNDQNARAYLYTPYFPEVRRLLRRPELDREFNRELLRLMDEDYTRAAVDPVLDRTFDLLRRTSGSAASPGSIKAFLTARRSFILSEISDPPAFTIETNGGEPFSTAERSLVLRGSAPFAVAGVLAAGQAAVARWVDRVTWELDVVLDPGLNDLQVFGFDSGGDLVATARLQVSLESAASEFTRGDANGDGSVNLSDVIGILGALFGGGSLSCEDSADVDDSGRLDLADAVFLLDFLFVAGSEPPRPPYPGEGPDPTPDDLVCTE